jgi:hypothetical protein
MLAGYADEHVKFAIVEGLRRRGMDVVTVQERSQEEADDEVLLETTTREGRLLLTNDVDFLRIHDRWMKAGREHSGIIYWRQDLGIGVAIRRILQYALRTSPTDAAKTVNFL